MLRFASCLILDIVSGINSHTVLWYASRATGVVALLLMTAVLLLGLLVTRQGRLPGLPRFAVTGLHRNLSLVAVVFVVLHVVTAVADSYVHIPLISAVVPLASSRATREMSRCGSVTPGLAAAMRASSQRLIMPAKMSA